MKETVEQKEFIKFYKLINNDFKKNFRKSITFI